MLTFESPLLEGSDYIEIKKKIKNSEKVCITGCMDSGQVNFMSGITNDYKYSVIVTYDDKRAREIYEDYLLYDKSAIYYPAKDFIFYNADIHGNFILNERLEAIKRIINGEHAVIITSVDGLMDKLVPIERIKENIVTWNTGDVINLDEVKKRLTTMGYDRVSQVDMPGQYAIRGEILDIYPISEDTPVRIDLWDDEIDSIKYFDASTQRSVDTIESVTIYSATEYMLSEDEIAVGVKKLTTDMKKNCELFREKSEMEAAHRLKMITEEFVEQIGYGISSVSIDSYVN